MPARFISTRMYIGKWDLQVSVQKGKILGPNTPAQFISTRMYRKVYNSGRVHYCFLSLLGASTKQGRPLIEGAY